MEQMTRMNSRVDEVQDFVKTNVQPMADKKGKQHLLTNYPRRPRQIQGIKEPRRTRHTILTMYTSTRKP